MGIDGGLCSRDIDGGLCSRDIDGGLCSRDIDDLYREFSYKEGRKHWAT
jgi:hypothetical protein